MCIFQSPDCQHHPRLQLLCIQGGPISQLEAREISSTLVHEVEQDMASRGIQPSVVVKQISFAEFKVGSRMAYVLVC